MIPTEELRKRYYSIGEVSKMLKVNASLLRYWENEFKHLSPKKNQRGDRQFTEKDIRILETIYDLVKERGYTIEGAKKVLRSENKMRKDRMDVISRLEKIKVELQAIKDLVNG